MNQRIIMDVDTAWNNFKKSNQTSVEDKLDVILAQQQEILTDTSRVADLVPLVTGDKAEEDALEETGDLEGAQGTPMEGMDEGAMTDGESADNPFAFLDDEGEPDNAVAEGDEEVSEEDYEETDEDSDMLPEGFEADADWSADSEDSDEDSDTEDAEEQTDTDTEGASTDESDEDSTDESDEEESDESEENADDSEPEEEEEYISFDEIEDEEEDSKTKKSADSPTTKTIKSISFKTPMTVVTKVQKPNASMSFGRANDAETISEMISKSVSQEFDIGYGVDPHEATKNDWAMYRLLKKANQF